MAGMRPSAKSRAPCRVAGHKKRGTFSPVRSGNIVLGRRVWSIASAKVAEMHSLVKLGVVLVATGLGTAANLAVAAATYTKIQVRHANGTHVSMINNVGQVAGQVDDFEGPAFIRTPEGKVKRFAVDGAFVTIPRGLTDAGAVGGRYDL